MRTIGFFYRPDNKKAPLWRKKIARLIAQKYRAFKIVEKNPQWLIALGGDGTILEAARMNPRSLIIGLNLGTIGFLASVREPKYFLKGVRALLEGRYKKIPRMMLAVDVRRKNKKIFSTDTLNEAVIQNLLDVMELEITIEGYPLQYIRGTGVLVATATGSTAYNLSAHGPIVMPEIKCFIITELLDHNLPTPSVVIKWNRTIKIKVLNFRKKDTFSISQSGQSADVILACDGATVAPLEVGDEIIIKKSPREINFAEFEPHYFFKSLQEKFAFK
ncbi:MAG: NAD(+)/NADH kinase [Parcubacteria group bacterium]|nr:NAD(+)/NADH kinase [Parcubacteria group bacterium]